MGAGSLRRRRRPTPPPTHTHTGWSIPDCGGPDGTSTHQLRRRAAPGSSRLEPNPNAKTQAGDRHRSITSGTFAFDCFKNRMLRFHVLRTLSRAPLPMFLHLHTNSKTCFEKHICMCPTRNTLVKNWLATKVEAELPIQILTLTAVS